MVSFNFSNTLYSLVALLFVWSCSGHADKGSGVKISSDSDWQEIPMEFAKVFSLKKNGNATLLEVKESYKGGDDPRFYLFSNAPNSISQDTTYIRRPVDRLVCTSTTQLPPLDMLGLDSLLVGFPSTQYISSPGIRSRLDEGKIVDLGIDNAMNLELLIDLDPDLLIGYTYTGDLRQYNKIEKAGIPVLFYSAYLEETPLGRAEWIRLMGALFGRQGEADSIFEVIKSNYLNVKSKVEGISHRPEVFSGLVYKDIWYMPGGNSWAAKFLKDAGANFLWSDSDEYGSIELSFEAVYEQAHDADYWIGTANFSTLEELGEQNERYKNFLAFKDGQVYSYHKRMNASGGNDYFETGFARPDIVLSDLVKILHPELLPDHELYFYQQLKP